MQIVGRSKKGRASIHDSGASWGQWHPWDCPPTLFRDRVMREPTSPEPPDQAASVAAAPFRGRGRLFGFRTRWGW